jgi:hypothetical protein
MAQFPTSAKTFTSKSNGQVIDAAHVQDLQDEVAAIEDGYLNGTARLNAGASTLASLVVTGNLTVNGTASIASPSARVFNSSNTQITAATLTAINWTSQKWITSGMHSTGTNPSRLIPTSSGVYNIIGSLSFDGNAAAGLCAAFIRIDGSTYVATQSQAFSTVGGEINVATVSALYRFASTTQYAELVAYRAGANSTIVASGELYPWFSMVKVG